ncbi:hypothetical protein [Bacillus weihaiensis]|uniref:Uncharacterized protein n=1 Tax=Bacillus weihaiensis TaxID=1547283 RepID=A0A1L3MU44_9BACI|nr:hypothetical protein [Bacillus weihaiensis]APH05844.1 hypothetical protein A9C19_14490 [Bacillus weihaiensis]
MFNPLETNTNDVQFLLDNAGKDVLINGETTKVLITNPSISEAEERYIHTLSDVSRGDLVELEGEYYLVITESITKRNSKYKALIRHCNYVINIPGETTKTQVGTDVFGLPIYEYIEGESIFVPIIIEKTMFSVSQSSAIRLPNNQMSLILQDNSSNKDMFKINYEYDLYESKWKVINRDFTKNGLLILTCEIV